MRLLAAFLFFLAMGLGVSGVACAQPLLQISNAASTGTTIGKLAKPTGAPATAVISTTSDAITAILGVVHGWTGTSGTTGSALITQVGIDTCAFDGATTSLDYVGPSTSVNGDCTDLGATPPSSGYIGRVLATIGSAGNASVVFSTLSTAPIIVPTASLVNGNGTALGSVALGSNLSLSGSFPTQTLNASGGFLEDTITTATNPTSSNCGTLYVATTTLTVTMPATSTLNTSCQIGIKASGTSTVVTVAINAADAIGTGTTGVGTYLLTGNSQIWSTDAAGHWWRFAEVPACVLYTTSNASIPISGSRLVAGRMMGVGGSGGNGQAGTTSAQVDSGGAGGAPGQYTDIWVVGSDISTQLGTTVDFTLASPPSGGTGSGGAGATSLAGSNLTFTANGGGNGQNGSHAAANGGSSPSVTQSGSNNSAVAGGCSSAAGGAASACWGFGQGGSTSSSSGSTGSSANTNNGPYAAAGGPSGGGVGTGDTANSGANGSPGFFGTGAGAGGSVASPPGGNATDYNTAPYVPGSSGGSGASSVSGNGGNGGASGWGAGGAGGGGCYNATSCTAGTGSAGGAGWLQLCQW